MMFDSDIKPKPPVLKPRPVPKLFDDIVGSRANDSGHITRDPNQCYNIKLMQYNQRKTETELGNIVAIRKKLDEELISAKYMKHNVHKSFHRTLNDRLKKKLVDYDKKIEERRKKLTDLLWKEERVLIREVVDTAQKAKAERMEEKIEKMNKMREAREVERLAIVKEKRQQQYISRCSEFRPALANQRLRETKQAQLLQIEEHKSRKEHEAELEKFWHEMKLKYTAALDERERQDRLKILKQNNEFIFYSNLQAKEKMIQQEQKRQEMLADRARLDKLRNDLKEEERAFLEKKRINKMEQLNIFKEKIKARKDTLQRIADQESKIQKAYDELADQEIKKEIAVQKAKISTGYQDMVNYKKYLAELNAAKKEDERIREQLIENTRIEIQKKQEEEKCKVEKAKQDFQESVMKTREQQIEERKKHDEELRKAKELEIQLIKESREKNEKLRQEYDRQNILKAKAYSVMLKEQMEYSRVLEERERENLRKILESAKIENQTYDRIVAEVLSGDLKVSEVHPFKQVVDAEKCPCPKPNY